MGVGVILEATASVEVLEEVTEVIDSIEELHGTTSIEDHQTAIIAIVMDFVKAKATGMGVIDEVALTILAVVVSTEVGHAGNALTTTSLNSLLCRRHDAQTNIQRRQQQEEFRVTIIAIKELGIIQIRTPQITSQQAVAAVGAPTKVTDKPILVDLFGQRGTVPPAVDLLIINRSKTLATN